MPLNINELDQLLTLMTTHNVRQLTVGDISITKDQPIVQATAPTKKKRPTPKDPLDELVELTASFDQDE